MLIKISLEINNKKLSKNPGHCTQQHRLQQAKTINNQRWKQLYVYDFHEVDKNSINNIPSKRLSRNDVTLVQTEQQY